EAKLEKATNRPSAERDGRNESVFPCTPFESTLTRFVVPVRRSRTKTSGRPLVSPGNRFEAKLSKATWRPSPEKQGEADWALACAPLESTLAREVCRVSRS